MPAARERSWRIEQISMVVTTVFSSIRTYPKEPEMNPSAAIRKVFQGVANASKCDACSTVMPSDRTDGMAMLHPSMPVNGSRSPKRSTIICSRSSRRFGSANLCLPCVSS